MFIAFAIFEMASASSTGDDDNFCQLCSANVLGDVAFCPACEALLRANTPMGNLTRSWVKNNETFRAKLPGLFGVTSIKSIPKNFVACAKTCPQCKEECDYACEKCRNVTC